MKWIVGIIVTAVIVVATALQVTHGVVSGAYDNVMHRGQPQSIALTANQSAADQRIAPAPNLAAVNYVPVATVNDTAVPGHHFDIYVKCTFTVTVRNSKGIVGYNYTENYATCTSDYAKSMKASNPGLVVDNGSIVAELLPDGKGNYYWVAIPQGTTKKPTTTIWRLFSFPKKDATKDRAEMLSAMTRVPTILGGATSTIGITGTPIGVSPFLPTHVQAGMTPMVNLAALVVQLTH